MSLPGAGADFLLRKRQFQNVLRAIFLPRQYKAAVQAVRCCRNPVEFIWRYATGRGSYPASIGLRTPVGPISITVYSWHDVRTIHEIFLALDYQVDVSDCVIADFGANIGVSAAYFLSRNKHSFAYLFEPAPRNALRLRQNLEQFSNRYLLQEAAVGVHNGKVRFGIEETGRYGGIEVPTGKYIEVQCRDSNEVLQEIVDERQRIDVLKVDVEGAEKAIVTRLTPKLAAIIPKLFVEFRFFYANPLAVTHSMTMRGTVVRFEHSRSLAPDGEKGTTPTRQAPPDTKSHGV